MTDGPGWARMRLHGMLPTTDYDWVEVEVEEVSEAMREQLGPLLGTGAIGATPVTTLYGDPALREPPEPPRSKRSTA